MLELLDTSYEIIMLDTNGNFKTPLKNFYPAGSPGRKFSSSCLLLIHVDKKDVPIAQVVSEKDFLQLICELPKENIWANLLDEIEKHDGINNMTEEEQEAFGKGLSIQLKLFESEDISSTSFIKLVYKIMNCSEIDQLNMLFGNQISLMGCN